MIRLVLGILLILAAGAVLLVKLVMMAARKPPPAPVEATPGRGPVVVRRTGTGAAVQPAGGSPIWIAAVAVLGLGGILLIVTGFGSRTVWERGTSWEGAFSAEWPAPVQVEETKVAMEGFGDVTVRREVVKHSEGTFSAAWADLWDTVDAETTLDAARAMLPGEVTSQQSATLEGQDAGRQVTLAAGCLGRLHVARKRVYVLSACAGSGPALRFLDSFRIDGKLLAARPTPTPLPSVDTEAARRNAERYLALVRAGRSNEAWMYLPETSRSAVSKKAHAAYWKKTGTPGAISKVEPGEGEATVVVKLRKGTVKLRAMGALGDPGIVPSALTGG